MAQTIGTYELDRYLATGGMAEIWIGRKSGPAGFEREVAIKRILPHLARDERFTSMFLDEATIASRLNHPNIVQIFELGEADGEYFIAMEYIDGPDLAHLLDISEESGRLLPIDVSVRIVADILSALDFAHGFEVDGRPLDIVHRDVSPHNVLVSKEGMVKLVDFGVAKAVERHHKTETGLVKGKLSYMAPEQIEEADVDRRADVFSAGVLLHELLTGETPFGRELTAVSAILHDDPQDPREKRPEIAQELVDVIFRALEKDREDRYPTAHDMLADLEEHLRSRDTLLTARDVADAVLELEGLPPGRELTRPPSRQTSVPLPFEEKQERARAAEPEASERGASARRTRDDTVTSGEEPPRLQLFTIAMILLVAGGVGFVFHEELRSLLPGAEPEPVATEMPTQPTVDAPRETDFEDPLTGASGFQFSVEEIEIPSPEAAHRIASIRYERAPEEYLFFVREARIRSDLGLPVQPEPPAVDPGDPDVVDVLDFSGNAGWAVHMGSRAVHGARGEAATESVEEIKRRRRRARRLRLRARREKKRAARAAAAAAETERAAAKTEAPKEATPKDDDREAPGMDIIDRVVPDF